MEEALPLLQPNATETRNDPMIPFVSEDGLLSPVDANPIRHPLPRGSFFVLFRLRPNRIQTDCTKR